MPRTVLVTGAAGFIGSHVSAALLARGDRVVGLDNFDPFYPRTDKLRNLAEIERAGNAFIFVEGDLTDDPTLARVFREHPITGVIHLAGKAGVRPSLADPAGYMHTNVTGTARVLTAAHRAGCGRVTIASSSSVYGNAEHSPFSEDQDVSRPISPYAASKRACELLAHAHHSATRQPVTLLRFFTVFGPRQRPDLAIMSFMRAISEGRPIRMFGDGSTARDYTYVDDIVAGVLAAFDRTPDFGYRIWNLGNNRPITLTRMISAIEETVGRKALVQREGQQTGDVDLTCADITRSGKELGYQPRVPFEEGLRRQWAWLRTHA